ncbi:hypothetical protein ACHAXT_003939 [Thalassiosira profunda]
MQVQVERIGPDSAARYLFILRYSKWALILLMAAYLTLASRPTSVHLLVDDANRAQVLGSAGVARAADGRGRKVQDVASFDGLWEGSGSSDDVASVPPVATPQSNDAQDRVAIDAATALAREEDEGLMQTNIVGADQSPKEIPVAPIEEPNRRERKNRKSNIATTSMQRPLRNEGNDAMLPLGGTLPPPIPHSISTDIDIVSLTVSDDFPVLFNNSALASWLRYIQNVRSVTFIGRPSDYALFLQNMHDHYPHLLTIGGEGAPIIRWVNETYFQNIRKRLRCPYPSVCQQLIKLNVFDLRTKLGIDIGDNVLIVDSDTVWSRNATFVYPDGRVQYWDARGTAEGGDNCDGADPVEFTEAITAGPVSYANVRDIGTSRQGPRKPTLSPYKACRRPEYPDATGGRHIVHHMLFQSDVMKHLHSVVASRWKSKSLWEAFNRCYQQEFCQSRVAEYELYFAFVSENYPQRVKVDVLTNLVDYMGSSAICTEEEMQCCERKGVLLKGCHDHRIQWWKDAPHDPATVGDMCCPENTMNYVKTGKRRRAKGGK